jgi:hypothetical protein
LRFEAATEGTFCRTRYTQLLLHLLNRALTVCANIGRLTAGAGYDSQDNRECCRRYGVLPPIRA